MKLTVKVVHFLDNMIFLKSKMVTAHFYLFPVIIIYFGMEKEYGSSILTGQVSSILKVTSCSYFLMKKWRII